MDVEEIIDDIANRLLHTQQTNKVILLGDFNCRIDQASLKTSCLLEDLLHENLICMNDPKVKTYVGQWKQHDRPVLHQCAKQITQLHNTRISLDQTQVGYNGHRDKYWPQRTNG